MGGQGSGRTRRAATPAEAAAAKRKNETRKKKHATSRAAPGGPAPDLDLCVDDPAVVARLSKYRIDPPTSWQEAKIAEQTRAEIYRTIAAQVALAEARASLVPSSYVKDRCDAVRDALIGAIRPLPTLLTSTLGDLGVPPAHLGQIATALERLIAEQFAKAARAASEPTPADA